MGPNLEVIREGLCLEKIAHQQVVIELSGKGFVSGITQITPQGRPYLPGLNVKNIDP